MSYNSKPKGRKGGNPKRPHPQDSKRPGQLLKICKSANTPRLESAYISRFWWYITAFFYKAPTGNHTVLKLHAFSLPAATLISSMILPPAGQKDSVQLTGLLRLGVIFLLTICQGRNRNPPMSLFHLQTSANTGFSSEFSVNFIQLCFSSSMPA